jgi:hypothetical protein
MPPSYKTIATFYEHTAEMLEGVSDNAELVKRHRASWSGCATVLLDCLKAKPGRSVIGPNFGPKLANTRRNTVTLDALVIIRSA